MNKKCITTVFTFLFFYVTVALVYAKSGHMYHKNLITFSSYLVSFFSGDFYFLHAYAIIIPFVYLVYLPRMMAPQTSYFVCRYQTRYQYFRYQYWTVLCFTLLFAALHILSGGIYLFTQIGFRYLNFFPIFYIFLCNKSSPPAYKRQRPPAWKSTDGNRCGSVSNVKRVCKR